MNITPAHAVGIFLQGRENCARARSCDGLRSLFHRLAKEANAQFQACAPIHGLRHTFGGSSGNMLPNERHR